MNGLTPMRSCCCSLGDGGLAFYRGTRHPVLQHSCNTPCLKRHLHHFPPCTQWMRPKSRLPHTRGKGEALGNLLVVPPILRSWRPSCVQPIGGREWQRACTWPSPISAARSPSPVPSRVLHPCCRVLLTSLSRVYCRLLVHPEWLLRSDGQVWSRTRDWCMTSFLTALWHKVAVCIRLVTTSRA